MKHLLTIAVLGFSFSAAHAQSANTGVLQPPPEISTILSIDAHNALIIGERDPRTPNAPENLSLVAPRHIYSGGIARVLGGTIVPTELFVIPESALRGNSGNGGFGRQNSGGQNFGNQSFGGQNNTAFNRGFSSFSPRVPVQNRAQFDQAFGTLDRPIPQTQVQVTQQ